MEKKDFQLPRVCRVKIKPKTERGTVLVPAILFTVGPWIEILFFKMASIFLSFSQGCWKAQMR